MLLVKQQRESPSLGAPGHFCAQRRRPGRGAWRRRQWGSGVHRLHARKKELARRGAEAHRGGGGRRHDRALRPSEAWREPRGQCWSGEHAAQARLPL